MTHEELKSILEFDPDTGGFKWLVRRSQRVRAGTIAGSIRDEYMKIGLDGKIYLAHRIAWFYMTGEWPSAQIDHLDGDKLNNRWRNLRAANNKLNCENRRRPNKNSRSGLLGASPRGDQFTAQIKVGRKTHWLGDFPTALEAHQRYVSAKRALHEGNTL